MTIFNNFFQMSSEPPRKRSRAVYAYPFFELDLYKYEDLVNFFAVPNNWRTEAHYLFMVLAPRGTERGRFSTILNRMNYIIHGIFGILAPDRFQPNRTVSPYIEEDIPSIRRQVDEFLVREGWPPLVDFLRSYEDDLVNRPSLDLGWDHNRMIMSFLYPIMMIALQGDYNIDQIPPSSLRSKLAMYEPLIVNNALILYENHYADPQDKKPVSIPTWAYPWHRKGPAPPQRDIARREFILSSKPLLESRRLYLWSNYEELLEENKKKALKMYVTDDPEAVTYIMGGTHSTGFWIQVFYRDGSDQTFDFMPPMPPRPEGV